MQPIIGKKEKILALLTVFFLFSIVGSIFFVISLRNKEEFITLTNEVKILKIKQENLEKLEKIYFDNIILPEVTSKSYLTLAITDNQYKKILAEKNPNLILPIASITKLMLAVITLENIDKDTEVTAISDYIGGEESAYILEVGKKYKISELLANALISSDNDSARLISSTLGNNNFIDRMNIKAFELGLTQTSFSNVTGLDPIDPKIIPNSSTVTDIANLLIYIKNKHPEILKISTNDKYSVCDTTNYCKMVTSTDILLEDKDFGFKIIGGKTGTTDLAGKNLALMTKLLDGIVIINVVLGSTDNFMDTTSLINNIKINN